MIGIRLYMTNNYHSKVVVDVIAMGFSLTLGFHSNECIFKWFVSLPWYSHGEQGWRSGERARLSQMWPGFDSGPVPYPGQLSLLLFVLSLLRGFFSGFSGFLPSTKCNISEFQFNQNRGAAWKPGTSSLNIEIYFLLIIVEGFVWWKALRTSNYFAYSLRLQVKYKAFSDCSILE